MAWLETLLLRILISIYDIIHPRQALSVGIEKRKFRADAKALRRYLGTVEGRGGESERADLGWNSAWKGLGARSPNRYLMRQRLQERKGLGRYFKVPEQAPKLQNVKQLRGSLGHVIHLQRSAQLSLSATSPATLADAIDRTVDLLVKRSATAGDLAFEFEPVPCSRFEALVCRPGEDAFFPRLRSDIEAAEHHINIAMYGTRVEKADPTSTASRMVKLLAKKVAEGVPVNFIYDAFGTGIVGPRQNKHCAQLIHDLSKSGILCVPNDPWDVESTETLMRLDHRKLYVIDGKIAYVGGMGIEDHFENDTPDKECHDVMARLEGEVVKQFQCAFLSSLAYQLTRQDARHRHNAGHPPAPWHDVTNARDADSIREYYFPQVQGGGGQLHAKCLMNVPVAGIAQISEKYKTMARDAKAHVYFMNPHSSEDEIAKILRKTAKKLAAAGKTWRPNAAPQGVLGFFPNGESNAVGKLLMRHEFPGLLKSGAKILLFKAGWLHGKVALQDLNTAVVGSCNLDRFSMARNWELAVCVEDEGIARDVNGEIFVRAEPPSSEPARYRYSIWRRIVFFFGDLVDRWF